MKYELTDEKKEFLGITLYRIRAVKDFELSDGTVIHAGDLGGWIEKESNLSHEGSAWVYGDAQVFRDAQVYGDARVCKTTHYLIIGPVGSRDSVTTFFRNADNGISVACGCFLGSIDKFLEAVKKAHVNNQHAQVYAKSAELAKLQIDLEGENCGNE